MKNNENKTQFPVGAKIAIVGILVTATFFFIQYKEGSEALDTLRNQQEIASETYDEIIRQTEIQEEQTDILNDIKDQNQTTPDSKNEVRADETTMIGGKNTTPGINGTEGNTSPQYNTPRNASENVVAPILNMLKDRASGQDPSNSKERK